MSELGFASALELAAQIRARRVGCLELLDHMIGRVERLDSRTNAVVVRDFDRARDFARKLDQGEPRGALHGVPMTVKESFDIEGLPSSWGFAERRDNIAAQDSLAVRRLRAAGAVVFGKTNVPKALADWQSYNVNYGASANPWDHARTPGGSSGGGAAAVAAGFSALEVGSDIGGSIRVPSHFCGVFGHKPTWGLLPPRGHSLAGAAAMTDISVIGPMARSAADLDVAVSLLGLPDPAEASYRTHLTPPPSGLRGLRVAVWSRDAATHTDEDSTAAIEALADRLERAGATIGREARPGFDKTDAFHTYLRLLDAAMSGRVAESVIQQRLAMIPRLAAEDMRADYVMVRATNMTHRAWLAENEKRHQIRREWGAFFRDWDVLLCPAFGVPALPRTETGETWERTAEVNGIAIPYNDLLFWPGITGGFHLPASVAPIGRSRTGLPIGVQIAGPLYGDRRTIAVAGFIEAIQGGFTAPAGWQ